MKTKDKKHIIALICACLLFFLAPKFMDQEEMIIKAKIDNLARDYNKPYQDVYEYCYSSLKRGHACYISESKPE